ncbi:glyceraldehyde-3-phosphate dehydrogenase [Psychromonas sp. psych-6C06]|uniref:BamA/TamA family outer membrane protein n=1 Tax=Psychromonas sp. psych-6C06 TaxID=2058089 RepID=UPI000C335AA1|nr:BamA/TamA family outer membrane protein [Psychromonas sp. psych-6C06]PKF60252.1 glyceraldehyde-3-phosphate dehydrogenase [Psychromonas sp. psych-6C06]
MKKYKRLATALILPLLYQSPAIASFTDPVDGKFDLGNHLAENAYGFLPIPILITEPSVGLGVGVAGVFLHESEEDKEKRKQLALTSLDGGAQLIPPAVTVAGAAGTENGTWFAFAGHRRSWFKDSIRYVGGVGGGRANLDIYSDISIGGTNNTFKFATETRGILGVQHIQFRIAQTPLMLGAKQLLGKSTISSDNKVIDSIMALTLGSDAVTSGLGLTAIYDTRNNIFLPTEGYSVAGEYMVYDSKIGSDWNYSNLDLKAETYIPLAEQWILAFAGNYQYFNSDDTFLPPTVKPYVKLRGIPSYRYQGDTIATIQSQVSYKVDTRWLVSTFYGTGFTETKTDMTLSNNEELTNTVQAYGVGFRYQIARRYGLFIGADIAFSKDDNALYFNVGSGF